MRANDVGDATDPSVATAPGRGTVVWQDGAFVYTPEAGFTGEDTFTHVVHAADFSPLCTEATVTITITVADDPDPGGPGEPGDGGGSGTGGIGDGSGAGSSTEAGTGSTGTGAFAVTGSSALLAAMLALALLGAGVLLRRPTRQSVPVRHRRP